MPNYVELSLEANKDKVNNIHLGNMVQVLALNVMGYEEYIINEMEYINDIFNHRPIIETLQILYHGDFNPYADYFCLNEHNEYISYSSLDEYYEVLMDKKDELLEAIIKESFHDNTVYNEIENYLDWNGLLVEQSEGDENNA